MKAAKVGLGFGCERQTKDVVVDGWDACTGDDLGL